MDDTARSGACTGMLDAERWPSEIRTAWKAMPLDSAAWRH